MQKQEIIQMVSAAMFDVQRVAVQWTNENENVGPWEVCPWPGVTISLSS